jgi:predicted PhzF superfamily epimerase YddE/YHI9
MIVDGRLPQGYVVVCTNSSDAHSFLVRRLGPSVECPECGHTALSTDLLQAYYERDSRLELSSAPSVRIQPRRREEDDLRLAAE